MSVPGEPPSPQEPGATAVRPRQWWRRRPASLYDLSPGSAGRDGWGLDRRTLRRRRIRNLAAGVLGLLLVGFVAVPADAYAQSYRTYKDLRGIVPTLTAARHDLAQGELPPGDPIGAASATAPHARLPFGITMTLPAVTSSSTRNSTRSETWASREEMAAVVRRCTSEPAGMVAAEASTIRPVKVSDKIINLCIDHFHVQLSSWPMRHAEKPCR